MYVGRIVAVGTSPEGKNTVMYRVSSRSFPNREARLSGNVASIMPREGFEDDLKKSPYIAYNCIRLAGDYAVATNGSHTDPIAEKIAAGMPPRDALALSLLAMDYEKDNYNTPRIAAVCHRTDEKGFLAIVRKDALLVKEFKLTPGRAWYVATYEKNVPQEANIEEHFGVFTADEACGHIINGGAFAFFELPVTSACAMAKEDSFEVAVKVV